MIGLDTNVLVRHLVQDEPRQSARATRFHKPYSLTRAVAWVLESAYGYRRQLIAEVLERIIRTAQFRIEDTQSAATALRGYRGAAADFADCLLIETNRRSGCAETVTFDKSAGALDGARLLVQG
ncbi:MAG: PIN domain-containing protein [Gammaproteobacteria bacterium]